jgi:hypothetical protein
LTAPSHSLPSKLASAAPQPSDDADAADAVDGYWLKSQLIQMNARFRDAMTRAANAGPLPPSPIRRPG